MSLFEPKEPLEQRSANLFRRQWARLVEIGAAKGMSSAEVLREIVDLGLQEYAKRARQSLGGKGKK